MHVGVKQDTGLLSPTTLHSLSDSGLAGNTGLPIGFQLRGQALHHSFSCFIRLDQWGRENDKVASEDRKWRNVFIHRGEAYLIARLTLTIYIHTALISLLWLFGSWNCTNYFLKRPIYLRCQTESTLCMGHCGGHHSNNGHKSPWRDGNPEHSSWSLRMIKIQNPQTCWNTVLDCLSRPIYNSFSKRVVPILRYSHIERHVLQRGRRESSEIHL